MLATLSLSLVLLAAPNVQGDGGAGASFSSESRCAELLGALKKNDIDGARAHFDATMRSGLPAARLREVWKQVTDGLGALESWNFASVTVKEGNDVCLADLSFSRGGLRATVAVNTHTHEVTGFFLRPHQPGAVAPNPLPPGVRAEGVTLGSPPYLLKGTLTLPVAGGRHPAVVLLAGSGPQDRDETVGASAPLRDLAQGLSAKGLVVLRYDKRTLTYGAEMKGTPITVEEEVLADGVAALAWLRQRPEVDPARVWVVGHSLGALLAPEVARRDGKVGGAVLLAPPGRPVPQLAIEQLRLGKSVAPERMAELERTAARIGDGTAGQDELFLGVPAAYWMDLGRRDMLAAARALGRPVLVLRGSADEQVFAQDLARWAAALRGVPRSTVETMAGVNHFLLPAGEGGPEKPALVDPRVTARVADFVGSTR